MGSQHEKTDCQTLGFKTLHTIRWFWYILGSGELIIFSLKLPSNLDSSISKFLSTTQSAVAFLENTQYQISETIRYLSSFSNEFTGGKSRLWDLISALEIRRSGNWGLRGRGWPDDGMWDWARSKRLSNVQVEQVLNRLEEKIRWRLGAEGREDVPKEMKRWRIGESFFFSSKRE
jgi:hypothetical protein